MVTSVNQVFTNVNSILFLQRRSNSMQAAIAALPSPHKILTSVNSQFAAVNSQFTAVHSQFTSVNSSPPATVIHRRQHHTYLTPICRFRRFFGCYIYGSSQYIINQSSLCPRFSLDSILKWDILWWGIAKVLKVAPNIWNSKHVNHSKFQTYLHEKYLNFRKWPSILQYMIIEAAEPQNGIRNRANPIWKWGKTHLPKLKALCFDNFLN